MAAKSKEFGERFKKKVKERYSSFTSFASKFDMSPQSLQNYFRGRVPDPIRLELFAKALSVTPRWLLTGQDLEVAVPEKEKYYELIPHIKGRLSCGPGTVPPGDIKDWLWIPKKYLPGGGDVTRFAAVTVTGESMYPKLLDGEVVIIDRTDCDLNELKGESLYAVWKEDEDAAFVKQLSYEKAARLLMLISFNRDARPQVEHIDLRKGAENPIMGKVVFSFRRWK